MHEPHLVAVLEDKLRATVRKLVVSVEDDEVVLRGFCRLYYHKQLATHEAMRLFAGKRLVNNIQVSTLTYPG